jgi:arsenite-transporting ATPase
VVLVLARSGVVLVVSLAGLGGLLRVRCALQRCDVVGARLFGERLLVSFTPDPTQWRTP